MVENRPIANVEMAQAWDGDEGASWAAQADAHDRVVAGHHAVLMRAAAIEPSHRVLDIGCGNGRTTLDAAAAASDGEAIGYDLSGEMLREARARAEREGIANVRFEQADAQVHQFEASSFDRVLSRFGCMFFGDPLAAFTNVHGALRGGARLAMLSWQPLDRNEWLQVMRGATAMGRDLPTPPSGAPGPFGLSDKDMVRELLTNAGFRSVELTSVEEPMRFGETADEALAFALAAGPVRFALSTLDPPERAAAQENLRTAITEHVTEDGVRIASAAWLITGTKDP